MDKISFWQLLEGNKVVIPIIQRDYAQGRIGKEHIREKFLTQIKVALEDPKKRGELDFVYGTTKEDVFYPLDGQQRLTTLWLLHWFVASKAGKLDEAKERLKKFSYETRTSSREFCEKLCGFDISKVSKASDAIQKQTWFYTAWKRDPTIQSMLRMIEGSEKKNRQGNDFIDGLEELFKECDQLKLMGYWNKLKSDDCSIKFSKLEINSNELPVSDDLYIKMNARGKPLTDFENFKADLLSSLEDNNDATDYGSLIDNNWTNHFWNNDEIDIFDKKWMAFLCRLVVCIQIEKLSSNNETNEKIAEVLKGWSVYKDDTDKSFSYAYKDFRDFKGVFIADVLDRLENIFKGWSNLSKLDNFTLDSSWGDDFCFIPKNVNGAVSSLTMKTRVLFYGTMLFCEKCGESGDCSIDKWNAWRRVMWNLAENTNESSTVDGFVGVIKMFNQLDKGCLDIYNYLYEKGDELKYDFEQLKEEKDKVKHIIKDLNFETFIKEAESLSCLKGKINVLFQNGDNTSFDEFKQSLNLLKKILEKSNTIPYYLQKVILSKFEDDLSNCVIDLKDTDENKKTMLTKTLVNCFVNVSENDIQSDIPSPNNKAWINDLTQTNLLEKSRGKVVSCYRNVPVLWGTSGRMWKSFGNYVSGNVILGKCRNLIATTREISLEEIFKVAGTDFVSGKDVNFKYNNHWFQWYGVPSDGEYDIYLLKDDWKNQGDPYAQHQKDPTKQGDEQIYYCFKVEATETKDSFTGKLNELIQWANKLTSVSL